MENTSNNKNNGTFFELTNIFSMYSMNIIGTFILFNLNIYKVIITLNQQWELEQISITYKMIF
jgi:hypothetical protein